MRLPFGINYATDYFSQNLSELFENIPNVITHVDDILIFADSIAEHNNILKEVLNKLKNEGITLNEDKCVQILE